MLCKYIYRQRWLTVLPVLVFGLGPQTKDRSSQKKSGDSPKSSFVLLNQILMNFYTDLNDQLMGLHHYKTDMEYLNVKI